MSQRYPEGSTLDGGTLALECLGDDFLLALGGDLEQRLGLGVEFHPQIKLVMQIVFSPAVADGMFRIDLDQSLFVDVFFSFNRISAAGLE